MKSADAGLLDGLVVLEVTDTPAAAFAGVMAADFGATVIVLEPPDTGSDLRRLGPAPVQRVWWPVIARNKRSLALDVAHPGAVDVIARILAGTDLLVRDAGARADRVRAAAGDRPRAVDIHLHPTGSDRPDLWPWPPAPEFATAASGMMALTGEPDGPAAQPELPLADYCAAMMALSIGLAELRAARAADRPPEPVPMALHEALHRMNEWNVVVASQRGTAEARNGNRFPMNANIGNIFRTRDDRLLTVSAATPSVADRLLAMIGGAALRDDPRFSTHEARRRNMDALDSVVADWLGRHDADDAMQRVLDNDVVVGPICDAGALQSHRHLRERGDWVSAGDLPMPAVIPFTKPQGGRVRHAGPAPGADSDRVLAAFGFADDEIERLKKTGVVGG